MINKLDKEILIEKEISVKEEVTNSITGNKHHKLKKNQ